MRTVRIESKRHDLIACFVAGIEWVNDSAVAVVGWQYRDGMAFVVVEDRNGSGEDVVLRLTSDGLADEE